MTFSVESRPAGGFRVVNEYGHIAETRIPTRQAAVEIARLFTETPELCAGMLKWHERKTLAGPDTVQRPMKTGPRALKRRKSPAARRSAQATNRR